MSTPTPGQGPWAPRPGYRRASLPRLSTDLQNAGGPLTGRTRSRTTAPQAQAPQAVPEWGKAVAGRTSGWRRALSIALVIISALGFLAILWIVSLSATGMGQIVLVTMLACVPLIIVLVVALWIDRWEREPISIMLLAFLWGAGVSTIISMVVNTTASVLVAQSSYDLEGAQFFSAVVSAPIIEETTKGLGVLIIFLIWRRAFNGPVDGVVYAAIVAGGFAFAENIHYFVQYFDDIVAVFVMRGLFSPFAHVVFTAFTGAAIGISARKRSKAAWVWCTPIGLACAIALHAFWNGVISEAFMYYFIVGIPFFIACVGMVIWLRWAERMNMRVRLADYSRAGWLSPAEVAMLTTGSGRAQARRWARTRGPAAAQAMLAFQTSAAGLAQLRQQAVDGHAGRDFNDQERRFLDSLTGSRRVFLGQH